MQNRKIAIEPGLEPVKEALERNGYRTVGLDDNLRDVDAVIVRGSDDNLMGRQDILTKAPVIEATGRTPQMILDELERRRRQRG